MSYRYIGNKTRLAPDLVELVAERAPRGGRIADLMCGTASVSVAMARAGYRVFAADVMTFARMHARVRLTMPEAPFFEGLGMSYDDVLSELNSLDGDLGFYWREYSPAGSPTAGCEPRKYFSPDNAGLLDAVSGRIGDWYAAGHLTEAEHDLLRHDLVLATNRVANIAGTYGHYRSKWSNGALRRLELQPSSFSSVASSVNEVRQGRAEDIALGLHADLCYLDPPYTKRQYAANYHLPETIARGDEPEAIGVSGLRPWRDQYSDFCSKVRVRDSFRAVIEGMDCGRFLVSYSEDGLLSRQDMTTFLSEFGDVTCIEFRLQRFRSNQSPLDSHLREYVFDLTRA